MASPGSDGLAGRTIRMENFLYHIEVVNNWRRYDVVIALSEAAQLQLLVWVSISPRLASPRMKGVILNLTVISSYVPTLDDEEEMGAQG